MPICIYRRRVVGLCAAFLCYVVVNIVTFVFAEPVLAFPASFSSHMSTAVDRGYRIDVRARDQAGNVSEPSSDVIVYIDNTPPIAPTLREWTERITDENVIARVSGEPLADLHILMSGAGSMDVLRQFNDQGYLEHQFDLPMLGRYELTFQSFDAAGNASSPVRVVVERVSRESENLKTAPDSGALSARSPVSSTPAIRSRFQDFFDKYRWFFGPLTSSFRRDGARMRFRIHPDGHSELVSSFLVPPIIHAAYEVRGDVVIQGEAINKFYPALVTVEYPVVRNGWGLCMKFWNCTTTAWESKDVETVIRNAKVTLYPVLRFQQIAETWNDGDSAWSISLPQSETLHAGSFLMAKSQIYDDFDVHVPDRGMVNVDYRNGGKGVVSGSSNVVRVSEDLKKQVREMIGIEPEDGLEAWSSDEMAWTLDALSMLPKSFYADTGLQSFRKEQVGDHSKCASAYAFVSGNGKELVICNFLKDKVEHRRGNMLEFQGTLIHELTHLYQASVGNDVRLPNENSDVYAFYDLLFDYNPQLQCWVEGEVLLEVSEQFSEEELSGMFVSAYARSASLDSFSGGPSECRRPYEYMAEMVEYYVIHPDLLLQRENFVVSQNNQEVQTDLHIYEFIRERIFLGQEY